MTKKQIKPEWTRQVARTWFEMTGQDEMYKKLNIGNPKITVYEHMVEILSDLISENIPKKK